MSLSDRIFPAGPPRDGYILRVESVGSWESQFVGLGRLTAFMTPRLLDESHAVDDMGLNVVFLQRHRVEVGLKLILERADASLPQTHRLGALLNACGSACRSVNFGDQWARFAGQQQDYADLMDRVDPGAAAWRYPVDINAQASPRLPYVDLAEMERAGREFEADALGLVKELAVREPLPVEATEAEATAFELREVSRGCRETVAFCEHTVRTIRAETKRLTWGKRTAPDGATAKLVPVLEVSEALASRAENLLARIVGAFEVELPDALPPVPLAPIPTLDPAGGPRALSQWQRDYVKWFAGGFVEQVRPLVKAG